MAAVLMAVNPYQLWYGQEGKMYALITALTLLANWFWLEGIARPTLTRGGWRPWLAYLIVVSCAIYSHLLMIMIIPLHLLWFLLAWPQSRYAWRGYALALAGLTLPYLPLLIWQWPLLMAAEPQTGFSFVPFTKMLETLTQGQFYGLLPPPPWVQLIPILFLALVGIVIGGGAMQATAQDPLTISPWRRHGLLVAWLFVPVIVIYLLSLRQPVYTDRYVIWIAPALMILMALGVRTIVENAGLLGRPIVGALLLYTLGFWLYAGWQEKSQIIKYDLRSGVTYVDQRRDEDTLLILQIPHQEWAYRYYTGNFTFQLFQGSDARLGAWAEGLWTNNGHPDETARRQVDEQMRNLTTGRKELWLLSSEVEMWDSRHLMREWLDSHGTIVEQAEFHGVQVRHYELTGE
ncbi:MAG: hypothetical protein R2867_01845 [Caldilineaceae bacterium]